MLDVVCGNLSLISIRSSSIDATTSVLMLHEIEEKPIDIVLYEFLKALKES